MRHFVILLEGLNKCAQAQESIHPWFSLPLVVRRGEIELQGLQGILKARAFKFVLESCLQRGLKKE